MRHFAPHLGSIVLAGVIALPVGAQQPSADWSRCVNPGRAFSRDEQISGCTAVLQPGRETAADYAIAYYNRGIAYGAKGDHDRAIADFSEALKLNPTLAPAHNSRGLAYQAKGDIGRAISDYTEAIKLNPSGVGPYFNRGNAYREMLDYDRAIADYPRHRDQPTA